MSLELVKGCSKRLVFLIVVYLSLSGCAVVYKTTGRVLLDYTYDEAVPYVLSMEDTQMVCAVAESFAPFFFSFANVTSPPDQIAILFYMASATCSESQAWEHELRYLRAVKEKNVSEAQDARIAQKRALKQAATRQVKGYYRLVTDFGEPGNECPKFRSSDEELYYLIGLLNGVQALFNDIAAEGSADVPLSIGMKVGRATNCLDSEQWWGLPGALRAAIWSALPNSKPDQNIDPYELLNESIELGLKQGVRIVQVLEAQLLLGQGETGRVKEVIRQHVEVTSRVPSNPSVALLDAIATVQLQAISDRLWTEATGTRTPIGGLGTFPDDKKDEELIDIDDLL